MLSVLYRWELVQGGCGFPVWLRLFPPPALVQPIDCSQNLGSLEGGPLGPTPELPIEHVWGQESAFLPSSQVMLLVQRPQSEPLV